jgi:hypothetical protein
MIRDRLRRGLESVGKAKAQGPGSEGARSPPGLPPGGSLRRNPNRDGRDAGAQPRGGERLPEASAGGAARDGGVQEGHPSRKVIRPNLIEFAVHGARYAFPPVSGGLAGGVPTGVLASPLAGEVNAPECAFVWKYANGQARAATLSPIYPSAPFAALQNPSMHRKLALLDGIRTGGVRVRQISAELLRKELERGE